jgi:DNA mismatch endonuclease (patch repair protein)
MREDGAMTQVPPAPGPSSPAARAVMRGNRSTDTSAEIALRRELHRLGLRYRVNTAPVSGVRCRADVVFTRRKVAVFVDGCFWHSCSEHGTAPRTNSAYWNAKLRRNVERDRANDAALARAGWTVVRVWEHEVPESAARRVAAVVRLDEVRLVAADRERSRGNLGAVRGSLARTSVAGRGGS